MPQKLQIILFLAFQPNHCFVGDRQIAKNLRAARQFPDSLILTCVGDPVVDESPLASKLEGRSNDLAEQIHSPPNSGPRVSRYSESPQATWNKLPMFSPQSPARKTSRPPPGMLLIGGRRLWERQ